MLNSISCVSVNFIIILDVLYMETSFSTPDMTDMTSYLSFSGTSIYVVSTIAVVRGLHDSPAVKASESALLQECHPEQGPLMQ